MQSILLKFVPIILLSCILASTGLAAGTNSSEADKKETSGTPAAKSQANSTPVNKYDESGTDSENPEAVNQAWEVMWSGQREMVKEVLTTASKLGSSFGDLTQNLAKQMRPYEEEGRRLLVFVNTFKGYPNAMEAVSRRLEGTISDLQDVLEPVTLARSEAEELLGRVNYMSESIPDDTDRSKFSPEMQSFIQDIAKARLRLTAVLAQYNSLIPSFNLINSLETVRKEITSSLPELWKNHYLQKPISWLNPATWLNIDRALYYAWQGMLLRLPVELPTTPQQWGTALIRFFIGLIFVGVLCMILKSLFYRLLTNLCRLQDQ